MTTEQSSPVVPGVPLAALEAITDQNIRDVLRALVDGHHVRNGQSGSGDNRFVTAAEIGLINGQITNLGAANIGGAGTGVAVTQFPDIGRIVTDLQAIIMESPLFRDLGQRVNLIDAPNGKIAQMREDLLDAANKALAEFDAAAAALGDGVTDLADIFDGAIKQTKGIKTTLYDPKGAFPIAQAAILEINNVAVSSKSANASQLAGLKAAFYDPLTGLAASRADYVRLINLEASARLATASLVEVLSAQLNDPTTGLLATRADYVNKINLEATERKAVASSLNGLIAQVIDPATGKSFAEGMIATDRSIALTNNTALANQTGAVYASLFTKNKTFLQSTAPTQIAAKAGSAYQPATATKAAVAAVAPVEASPQIGDVWYNTADMNRPRRWNGSSWIDARDGRIAEVEGAILTEEEVRLSQDNAIASALKTVWATLGGNAGLIQTGESITVNTAGATATNWTQTQAAVRDSAGNVISSAAVKQTTEVLVDRAGKVEAKWVVNLDAGGQVAGFRQAGFGISGSPSFNGPTYSFGVRADSFWIASPGQVATSTPPTAQIPFIVQTAPWVDSMGVTQPPGTYLNDLFAATAKIGVATIGTAHIKDANITAAKIQDLAVETLKIKGNAVTVPVVQNFPQTTYGQGMNNPRTVATMTFPLDTACVVFATATGQIATGMGEVPSQTALYINGVTIAGNGGETGYGTVAHSGGLFCQAGFVTVTLVYWGRDAGSRIINPSLFALAAKR